MIGPHALGTWEALTTEEVRALMRGAPFRWWVVGGWAIDSFIGRETRPHQDVEIAIVRRDQTRLQQWLSSWDLWYVPAPGAGLARWERGATLADDVHEIWCRSSPSAKWQLEVLIEDADGETWRYRRDARVTAPLKDFGRTIGDLPVIRPEIALLYKSKATRPHDEADFRAVLPHLGPEARAWLRSALEVTGTAPDWVQRLSANGGARPRG